MIGQWYWSQINILTVVYVLYVTPVSPKNGHTHQYIPYTEGRKRKELFKPNLFSGFGDVRPKTNLANFSLLRVIHPFITEDRNYCFEYIALALSR